VCVCVCVCGCACVCVTRSTSRGYLARLEGSQGMSNKYRVSIKIGYGFTYSKYNTLMHFLNVMQCYWHNPDLNNIQVAASVCMRAPKWTHKAGGGGEMT